MIAGIFHQGSGLGDQLMRYITVRTLAENKGFYWLMRQSNFYKGYSFLSIDMHGPLPMKDIEIPIKFWNEKDVRENGIDIRSYDPEINFVEDGTIIDGNFEDEKYWGHNLDNIRNWLAVEPLEVPDDTVVIGFRGGEYATVPDLFLTKDYWRDAIAQFPGKHFEIHTDDARLAADYFADLLPPNEIRVIHHIGFNWRSVRYAKNLIIANSAFYILPALLNENVEKIIAPRGWARRNLRGRIWARPSCYYRKFTYI